LVWDNLVWVAEAFCELLGIEFLLSAVHVPKNVYELARLGGQTVDRSVVPRADIVTAALRSQNCSSKGRTKQCS
jgi:hypothetical protein